MTSEDTDKRTGSPGLAAGRELSTSQIGPTTDLFGRAVAPASRSARLEKERPALTTGISGLHGLGSSASVALTESLANRLKVRLGTDGSTEYSQTWRRKITPAGRWYWAHTASAPRTSGRGFGGWPTPTGTLADKGVRSERGAIIEAMRSKGPDLAALAGWPTASARDWKDGRSNQHGKNARPLNEVARLAGWPTLQARDGTPRGGQAKRFLDPKRSNDLTDAVMLAGWATPCVGETCDQTSRRGYFESLSNQARGAISTSSPAPTERRGALAPAFSLWLMGFPPEWESCAPLATRSSRRSPPRS